MTPPLKNPGYAPGRFVLQSRSTSAPLLDPRRRTRARRWFVLAFTDALRRSSAESSQIFEKLSLPCYRDRPSRILPSLHSLGQFLVSPKIQFVERDLSIFGTTLFTVCFERVHSAYGLIYILWKPEKATTGLATNLHGQVPQIVFIAQLTLSPPAFYVYRRLDELSVGSPFYRLVQSCRRVVACFLRLPYVKRRLCAAVLQVQCFSLSYYFFINSVSPVCPFLPLLFASGLRSEKSLFFPLSHFLCCSLLFRSPVHALRYKRYIFLRPGFEGFLPSPPRLAAILAWLCSHIVRFYFLSPF